MNVTEGKVGKKDESSGNSILLCLAEGFSLGLDVLLGLSEGLWLGMGLDDGSLLGLANGFWLGMGLDDGSLLGLANGFWLGLDDGMSAGLRAAGFQTGKVGSGLGTIIRKKRAVDAG